MMQPLFQYSTRLHRAQPMRYNGSVMDIEFHEKGNIECAACYPHAGECRCGGIVHIEFDDELNLEAQCDKCRKRKVPKEILEE